MPKNNLKFFDPKSPLPHKQAFFPLKGTYFDAGRQHPMSRGCVATVEEYINYKSFQNENNYDPLEMREKVKAQFAELINGSPHELSYVASTTAAENLIIQSLELTAKGGRVVTDDLHYFGSYQIYGELIKAGVEVVTIRNKNGKINMEQYEAAITDNTILVSVSGVSTFNAHMPDLKRLSKIAHDKGALLYADVIHLVGAVPFDVKDAGVDFCACASFKWLMADQGVGFLYVSDNALSKIKRPWFGKRQVRNLKTHVFPGDGGLDGDLAYEYELDNSTEGYFSLWSEPRIVIGQLHYSLGYLMDVGVENIAAYRQTMMDYLQREIPKLGFAALSPINNPAPIAAFACEDAYKRLGPILKEADISLSLYKGHFRVALSVYNDMDDIKYLIETLQKIKA